MQTSLLIASPQMRDRHFERTIVLLWHHGPDGAVGVVVNRPVDQRIEDVIEVEGGIPATAKDTPVVWGGPVETRSGTVVTTAALPEGHGVRLPNGLTVTHSQEALVTLLRGNAPFILCLGYAGWSAGQLDREIEEGGWLYTEGDAGLVFDTPAEQRYDKALASLGLTSLSVWMTPISE